MTQPYHPPSLDTDFESLSKNPLTQEQMHQYKEALLVPHGASQTSKTIITVIATAAALAFVTTLSPIQKEHIEFIDYLLVGVIAWGIGFLIFGWIDDFVFHRHQISLKIDGVPYQRRAYESMRERTSFWDPDKIDDLIVPQKAEEVHRYIDNVLHNVGRGFVRFDREMIRQAIRKHQ